MSLLKRIAAKTGGFTVGITVTGIVAVTSAIQKLFKKKGVFNENE